MLAFQVRIGLVSDYAGCFVALETFVESSSCNAPLEFEQRVWNF